jgi:hypothetical protein
MPARRNFLAAIGGAAVMLLGNKTCAARPRRCRYRKAVAPGGVNAAKIGGTLFTQPRYDRWERVEEGMSENEVLALLGPPLVRDTRESVIRDQMRGLGIDRAEATAILFGNPHWIQAFQWTYGRLRFDSPAVPDAYEFYLIFTEGRVDDKQDPFNGHLSTDGRPTAPVLISPPDETSFDHFPRFVDLRWTPSSGIYPIDYEIEISSAVDYVDQLEANQIDWDAELVRSPIPFMTVCFCGDQPGRWRVRGRNGLGTGEWSKYRQFVFT